MTRTTLRIQIEPLEPMLFGDNRSARSGEGHAVGAQDPSPATLFGAVGARIAQRLGARGERHWKPAAPVLGPFERDLEAGSPTTHAALLGYTLADADSDPWFPRPLHLRIDRVGESLTARELLRPAEPDPLSSLPRGWGVLAGNETLEDEVEDNLFVDAAVLAEVLGGELPGTLRGSALPSEAFFSPEPRLGLAMQNATNTAVPGALFARPYRRFRTQAAPAAGWSGAGFSAWFQILDLSGHSAADFDGPGFLGGDRRRASFRFAEDPRPLAELLARVCNAVGDSRGFLAFLLTPAPAPRAVSVDGISCVGAALGRPLFASGWSAAAERPGPRPLLHLVPAGSVFFFPWGDGLANEYARRQWIEHHWLAPLDPALGRAGFGRMLMGVWR